MSAGALRQQVIAEILGNSNRRIRLGSMIEKLYLNAPLPEVSATITSMLLKGEISLTHDRWLELGEVSLGA